MKKITLIDRAFLLKKTPLFSSLDLDLLLPIADKLSLSSYEAGEVVFSCKDLAHRMYLIVEGQMEIRDEGGELVAILPAGEFFGEESLFNDRPRSYTAQCINATTLLTLSQTNLFTIISECPSVAVSFIQAYSSAVPFRPRKGAL